MNTTSYNHSHPSDAGAGETQAQAIPQAQATPQAQANRTRTGGGGRQPASAAEVLDYLRHMEQRMVQTVGEPGALGRWTETLFPREHVRYVWALYRVGALADGRTVFFYTSRHDHTVDGKVMAYGPDGHRAKDDNSEQRSVNSVVSGQRSVNSEKIIPLDAEHSSDHCSLFTVHSSRVTWLHALDRMERPLPLPLFGEHLADALPFAPLCLVESEKTALVAKLWRPDCTWLATGGKSLLTAERLRVLGGRTLLVWPDADAVGEWMDKAALLGPDLGIRFRFPTAYLARIREGPPKGDLADLIAAEKNKTTGNP